MKKRYLILIVLGIILFLAIVFFPQGNTNIVTEILEENNINISIGNNIEKNEEFYNFIETINNISYLDSGKINTKIKYMKKEDNRYNDLLTCSYIANAELNDKKLNSDGFLNISIDSLDVNLRFPTYFKNLGSENYELLLEVPSMYKKTFGMNESEKYLKINNSSHEKLNETFKDFNKVNKIKDKNKESFKSTLKFNKTESINTGIYDICFDSKDIRTLYNKIESEYKDSIVLYNCIYKLLKNEENIENIYKLKGQIATSNGVATDIYLEIEYYDDNITAFRMTISEINGVDIETKELHSEEVKMFDTIITGLITDNEVKKDTSEKTITIGKIYFTGKDENKNVEVFTEEMLKDPINVFINYSKCSTKTNLIIKWYYSDQKIQIIENKLNNGEYEDGILKSSITFSDIKSVPKGTYKVEIYIDGQDNCYGKQEFKIE